MAANGISTLSTKELKQKAKLDLAAINRAAVSDPRSTYDITLLPTQYNNNAIVNNPNSNGLVIGRPWISTVSAFTFYEAFGTTTAISTTQYVSGNKIYAESSTYDVPSYQNARVVVNDIEVVNTALRGHTLVVLDSYGDVVTGPTQYDTYIDSANATALANALNSVATGNIVVLVVYDASADTAGLRSAINTGYGSTNSNTWSAERRSHIFIGIKGTVAPVTSLRSFLSGAGQAAYDAASADSFFAVSSSDWNAVVAGVASTSKLGPDDTNFNATSGGAFSGGYYFTMSQTMATVPANNYIIGFRASTIQINSSWSLWGSATFKSYNTNPYTQISTTTPSTGSGAGGTGTFYYLRKAPSVQAAATYVAYYSTQNFDMTPNGSYLTPPTGATSSAYSSNLSLIWSNWVDRVPKIQTLITPTAVT